MRKKWRSLLSLLIVLFGNALYALCVVMFILPANLVTGGGTGIALFLNYLFGIRVSLVVLIFNTAMLLLGWWQLGHKFAATTLLSTFSYPLFLELFQYLIGSYVITSDRILCTLFAGLLIGIALGLVFREGASTGGMDIPPLILAKHTHVNVSVYMNLMDTAILLMQMVYHKPEDILYGLLMVLVYTVVIDKLMLMGTSRTQVTVISQHSDKIRRGILDSLDRGVTMLSGSGGYSDQPEKILLSVISNRELPHLQKLILGIDPEAFIIVNRVSEVAGRGFTMDKHYRSPSEEK